MDYGCCGSGEIDTVRIYMLTTQHIVVIIAYLRPLNHRQGIVIRVVHGLCRWKLSYVTMVMMWGHRLTFPENRFCVFGQFYCAREVIDSARDGLRCISSLGNCIDKSCRAPLLESATGCTRSNTTPHNAACT